MLVGEGPSGCPKEFPGKGEPVRTFLFFVFVVAPELFCFKGGGLDRELSKSEKSKAGVYRNWVEGLGGKEKRCLSCC